jgi:hypothetical protein
MCAPQDFQTYTDEQMDALKPLLRKTLSTIEVADDLNGGSLKQAADMVPHCAFRVL